MAKKGNNLVNKILANPFVKWILIPVLLIVFWLSSSLIYSSYKSFTVIQHAHNLSNKDDFNRNKLLKSQAISGVFVAEENNLGIVEVRFGEIPKPSYDLQDTIYFRIKEVGGNKWLAENKYKSGAIPPHKYYPFGFTQINNSKGKIYKFVITSENGNLGNAIGISRVNPIYLSKYKFSKSEVINSPASIASFIYKKVVSFLTNEDNLVSSTVFLLPLIFYFLWLIFPIDKLVKNDGKFTAKKMFMVFVVVLIFSDVTFYEFLSNGFMLGLLGLWLISIYINKSKSAVTFWFAFSLIIYSVIGIYFKLPIYIDKSSAFAYFLLTMGFVQSIQEFKKQK